MKYLLSVSTQVAFQWDDIPYDMACKVMLHIQHLNVYNLKM